MFRSKKHKERAEALRLQLEEEAGASAEVSDAEHSTEGARQAGEVHLQGQWADAAFALSVWSILHLGCIILSSVTREAGRYAHASSQQPVDRLSASGLQLCSGRHTDSRVPSRLYQLQA